MSDDERTTDDLGEFSEPAKGQGLPEDRTDPNLHSTDHPSVRDARHPGSGARIAGADQSGEADPGDDVTGSKLPGSAPDEG